MRGIYILNPYFFEKTYGRTERDDIASLVSIDDELYSKDNIIRNPNKFQDVEFVFSGWYPPKMDEDFLSCLPNLKAVFYAGGSVRPITTEAFWDRKIRITCSAAMNAVPVAEYALAQILFCLKRGWYFARSVKAGNLPSMEETVPGLYQSVVGIVSLGQIGKRVCKLLQAFEVRILAYDPYIPRDIAEGLSVELRSLEDLFKNSDAVSIHTPVLDETMGMITGEHIASMPPYASLINAAKREIVREDELIKVLESRPDIQVVIDGHLDDYQSLTKFPNLVLTPYLAGSRDRECQRLGRFMVNELNRYLKGQILEGEVTREKAALLA